MMLLRALEFYHHNNTSLKNIPAIENTKTVWHEHMLMTWLMIETVSIFNKLERKGKTESSNKKVHTIGQASVILGLSFQRLLQLSNYQKPLKTWKLLDTWKRIIQVHLHQQKNENIVRQCNAHRVDKSGYKVTTPHESS